MLKHKKSIHVITFVFGLLLFLYAIFTAIFFHNTRFYTLFALGAYLVLDFIDYKINKTSVMVFFLNRSHWYALPAFLAFPTVGCFIVDFVLGVNTAKMWKWANYNAFDFTVMFTFMNASYILGMYEIFRIVRSFFKGKVAEWHLIRFRIPYGIKLPVAVFIGWVPLVISTICMVTLAKHLTYTYDLKKKNKLTIT